MSYCLSSPVIVKILSNERNDQNSPEGGKYI